MQQYISWNFICLSEKFHVFLKAYNSAMIFLLKMQNFSIKGISITEKHSSLGILFFKKKVLEKI